MAIRTIDSGSNCENRTSNCSILGFVRHIIATHKQRQSLSRLDDAALEDLGLTRALAESEASEPIRDVPAKWCRQK